MTIRELLQSGRTSQVPVTRGANPLYALQEEMNRLFGDFFGDYSAPNLYRRGQEPTGAVCPALDVCDNNKSYCITAELPGLNPDDVQITVADGYVTIRGEKRQENKEEREGYYRQERCYGTFQRTVALPDNANLDKAEANYNNGLLSITIPKKAGAESKERRLEIKRAA